jgi:hypothetical protein
MTAARIRRLFRPLLRIARVNVCQSPRRKRSRKVDAMTAELRAFVGERVGPKLGRML